MRGPKPKPAAVREQIAPVRSKRKKPEPSPAVLVGGVHPPRTVKGRALEFWNQLAPTLQALKLLAPPDVPAFARYCRLASRFEDAEKILDKEGITYESQSAHGNLKRAHPAAMLSMRYSRELLALETQFGLLPGERQRIMYTRAQEGRAGLLDLPDGGSPKAESTVEPTPAGRSAVSGFLTH